jgi:hypothetical protein
LGNDTFSFRLRRSLFAARELVHQDSHCGFASLLKGREPSITADPDAVLEFFNSFFLFRHAVKVKVVDDYVASTLDISDEAFDLFVGQQTTSSLIR